MTDESPEQREGWLPPAATWGRAIQDWEPVLGVDPSALLRISLNRARAEADAGRPEDARRVLERLRPALLFVERAMGSHPSARMAALLGLAAVALAALARLGDEPAQQTLSGQAADLYLRVAVKATPEFTARDRAELGLALAEAGHLGSARALLDDLPADDSHWGQFGLELGAAFDRHGDAAGAAAIYERAVGLAPDDPAALERLARALKRAGRAEPAAVALHRAAVILARSGRTGESHALLDRALADGLPRTEMVELKVDLLRAAGEPEHALEVLDRYAGDRPEPPRLLVARARCLLALERAEDALAVAIRARIEGADEPGGAIAEAFVLETLGRNEEAIEALEAARALDPANAIIHAAKADVQAREGHHEEALGSVDLALSLDPLLDGVLVLKSAILRELGRVSQALEVVRVALNHDPDDAAALAELGECLLTTGRDEDVDEAVAALERAVASRPDSPWTVGTLGQAYVRNRRMDDGIERLREASALDSQLTWPRDMLQAALLDRGDPTAALAVLDDLLADEAPPRRSPAARASWHARRGEALRQLGRLQEAQAALERSVELAPGDAYALGTLGQVLTTSGDADEGIERLQEAARERPPLAWVMRELVDALLDRGREADAFDALADARERGLARSRTLELLEQLQRRSTDRTALLERVATARRSHPGWQEAGLLASRLLAATGRLDDGLQEVDELLTADPDWDDALATRCVILTGLGREDQAHQTIDRVLRRDPASEPFVQAKLSLLDDAGQFDDMLAIIDGALALAPEAAWLYRERARALAALGRTEEAAAALSRAAWLQPDPAVIAIVVAGLRELRGPDGATELLEELLLQVHTPDRRVAIANELRLLDRDEEALAAVDTTLARAPDHGAALRLRGVLLMKRDRPLDALTALLEGITRPPVPPKDFAAVGRALCDVGRFEAALPWIDRALVEDDRLDVALGLRGWALQNMGAHQEAMLAWRAALDVEPDRDWYLKGLGDCLFLQSHRQEAVQHFRAVLERSEPAAPTTWNHALRGWCHYRLEHFEQACDHFIEGLAIDNLSLSSHVGYPFNRP